MSAEEAHTFAGCGAVAWQLDSTDLRLNHAASAGGVGTAAPWERQKLLYNMWL